MQMRGVYTPAASSAAGSSTGTPARRCWWGKAAPSASPWSSGERRATCFSSSKQSPHIQQQQQQQHASSSSSSSSGKGFSPSPSPPAEHAHHAHASSGTGARFLAWLQEQGAPEQAVTLMSVEPSLNAAPADDALLASTPSSSSQQQQRRPQVQHSHPHGSRPVDMVVAKRAIKEGEVVLRMPAHLVVTLDRIFESEFVAELLTTDKLSEMACLTLFLMFEKKLGEESFWYPYIKELDRQRARGTQAVESPLLWETPELDDLLQGSPLLTATKQRLQGIRKEYEELDTVWYMSKSLFNRYPFDLPTQTFSFDQFRAAFAAVQSSIVHLQGVPPAKRFALMPLGPPLLTYSSTSKAMLAWDEATQSVKLQVDRDYEQGEPVTAWCGPQPNNRLLLNYGLVDELNPYDKLQVTTILGSNDPLFALKRAKLQSVGLSTSQTWDLARNRPLPTNLLPFMRLAAAPSPEDVARVGFDAQAAPLADAGMEAAVRALLVTHLQGRMGSYKRSIAGDLAILAEPQSSARQKVAARLTKIEKTILQAALDQLGATNPASASLYPLPYLKLT